MSYLFDKKPTRCQFLLTEENEQFLRDKQPKIAIIAPTLDTVPSRYGNAIYDLVEDIVKNSQYPILIISRYFADCPASSISNQIIYFDFERDITIFEKIIGYRGRKYIWGISRTYDIHYLRKVLVFLKETSVKIIMLEDNASFFPAITNEWTKRFSFIHHQHINALLGLTRKFGKKYLRHVKEVVFVSQTNLNEAKEKHNSIEPTFRYIYNGINLANYPLSSKQEEIDKNATKFLFVGRIVPGKGVKELCQAALSLQKKNHIRVKIVGNLRSNIGGNSVVYIEEIKQLAEQSDDCIELVGQVLQNDLHRYYQWADFVVVPSVAKEGLPKVIFEALVMGKPIISSKRGGVEEFIQHGLNGILIDDPVKDASIAEALRNGIANKKNLNIFSRQAMNTYRQSLSSTQMASNFDQVFHKYL